MGENVSGRLTSRTMTFILNILPIHRSKTVLKSFWGISCRCWESSRLEASRGWLRRFLLLKLVTVLVFPHGARLPLLVGCMFSLRARSLLCSPHVSRKPSTVFLGQLALTDSLLLLHWMLQLGASLVWWMEKAGCEIQMGLVKVGKSDCWREAARVLCQQLLDAHHLASLLLLGLLGLEATLVSRWPQQTRRFRTSRWAQLSCNLVWTLVLLELLFSLHSKLLPDCRAKTYSSTIQKSLNSSVGLVPVPSLVCFSSCLRTALWLVNFWLHYGILCSNSQKRNSFFH